MESDHSDSTGLSGNPASERDLILTSTDSPFLIEISNWLILTDSGSATFSSVHS